MIKLCIPLLKISDLESDPKKDLIYVRIFLIGKYFLKNSKSSIFLLQYPLRGYRKFYTSLRATVRFRSCENFERAFWKI